MVLPLSITCRLCTLAHLVAMAPLGSVGRCHGAGGLVDGCFGWMAAGPPEQAKDGVSKELGLLVEHDQ